MLGLLRRIVQRVASFPTPIAWMAAWAVIALGTVGAGSPELWSAGRMIIGAAFAFLGWMIGVSGTVRSLRRRLPSTTDREAKVILGGWSAGFFVALWATWNLAHGLECQTMGRVSSIGFAGIVLGVALGGGLGGSVMGLAANRSRVPFGKRIVKALALALFWSMGFALGAYLCMVVGYVSATFVGRAVQMVGGPSGALALSWAMGAAVGGWLAGGIGSLALRLVYGSQNAAGADEVPPLRRAV